jgi:DNA-binding NarL/FixJ family response regulator
LARLTPREFEVLRMSTDGMPTLAVAAALHLSENTMSLVRQKLEVHSDFGLMRLVKEQGLVAG